MTNISRLRNFVQSLTRLIEREGEDKEEQILSKGEKLLAELITHDDWLPDEFARPDSARYQQFLLYCDPLERFSVMSFVWGPGQTTPIHDHTVWGMVGVMRGAELCEEFALGSKGELRSVGTHQVSVGGIDLVSPRVGDVHRVSNALADAVSISIHVYGANIGAVGRSTYNPNDGCKSSFISGYSNSVLPNIWDRSKELANPSE